MTAALRSADIIGGEEATAAAAPGAVRTLRLLIYGLCLASSTFQQGIVAVLPDYTRRFGLSGVQAGMLLAATAFSTMAVSLPAGALADRFGARRLTVAAGCLMAGAMLLEAFVPSFSLLLTARLVFGIGYGVVWTAGLAWLAGASADGSGLGGTVACSGIGGIIGPVLAGVLAGVVGLAVPFLVAAAIFVALTAGLGTASLPRPATAQHSGGVRHSAGALLRNRGIVAATAAVVVSGLTWSVTYLVGPEELRAAGVSTAAIGIVISAAAVVFVIGSMATASIGSRLVRPKWILVSIAAVALAFVPSIMSTQAIAIAAMMCGAAAARSVLWTVCYPLAARGAERIGMGVGVVMGFLQATWAITSVVSPLAAGALAGSASPRDVFALTLLACFGILGASIAWMCRRPLAAWLRALERGSAPA